VLPDGLTVEPVESYLAAKDHSYRLADAQHESLVPASSGHEGHLSIGWVASQQPLLVEEPPLQAEISLAKIPSPPCRSLQVLLL